MDFREIYLDTFSEIKKYITREALIGLSKHNYDWHPDRYNMAEYLKKSAAKSERTYCFIKKKYPDKIKILDVGGFFGVFPVTLKKMGYEVAITEKYAYYEGHFKPIMDYIKANNIDIYDTDPVLSEVTLPQKYDLITCIAVIEHLANSPKVLFSNFNKNLSEKGGLIIEVPNINYGYKIIELLRGNNILPNIKAIYNSKTPFIGHHHEYTAKEMSWLLAKTGFDLKQLNTYNYSSTTGIHKFISNLLPKSYKEIIWIFSQKRG